MPLQHSLPVSLYIDAISARIEEVLGVGLIPEDFLDDIGEKIGVVSFAAGHDDETDSWSVAASLEIDAELSIQIPGLDQLKLIIGARPELDTTNVIVNFAVRYDGQLYVSLHDIDIILQIDGLGAVELLGEQTDGTYALDGVAMAPQEGPIRIFSGGGCMLSFSTTGDFAFEPPADWSIDPFCIPSVGIGLSVQGLRLRLTTASPLAPELAALGLPADWVGVAFDQVQLGVAADSVLRPGLQELQLEHFSVGRGGVSGRISANWVPQLALGGQSFTGSGSGDLFGIPFGMSLVAIELNQNAFVAAELGGALILPYFESPVAVTVGFDLSGSFSVGIAAVQLPGANYQNGLVTVEKQDILSLTLESLWFAIDEGLFTVGISGSLTPLVAGIDWPSFSVQELSIDSEGHVRIEGGWLDLPDQYVLSLGGFQFEVSRIGFGTTEAGARWIGFSGGLKLVDGLTAGASVEGLRVAWDPATGDTSVTLRGIGVEFEVPGTVYFKGYVSMTEPAPGVTRFDGQILLSLTSLGLEFEAQLVVGYDRVNDYFFFAIYVGLELPAGIPLGQTGLGLFGLAGLFALQLEPDRRPDPNQPELPWYGIQPGPSWYHAPPTVGVAELRKWTNRQGSLALGAGITLGTVADNGYTFAGKFLLGIIFPGPILFIEGRANLLKERASLRDEPLFRALAVLDARAGTFLVGLDARYAFDDAGALIEIAGGTEAFFDFNDVSNWHLYLGIDEPKERRIRAEIFSGLFEANAYFMLDSTSLRTGAWIGYDASFEFGPLRVLLQAWIEGGAELSFKPVYLAGELWLHGAIEVSVFGFGFGLGADARMAAEVFDPFHLQAELSIHINLPWPLPDFSPTVELEWGPEPTPPLLPVPLKEVAVEHLKVTTTWPLPLAGNVILTEPNPDPDGDGFLSNAPPPAPSDMQLGRSDASPVVPMDARPRITFGRTVHDLAQVSVNPSVVHPSSQPQPGWEWIGDPSKNEGAARVRIALTELVLERWTGTRWEAAARKAAAANPAGVPTLYGSWAPVPQVPTGGAAPGTPAPTANVKLWLWSKSPYDFTRRTGGQWEEWFDRAHPDYPCIDLPPDYEACCDFAELSLGQVPAPPWQCAKHPEIALTWRLPPAAVVRPHGSGKALCFRAGSDVSVLLRRTVKRVRVFVDYARGKNETVCANIMERREGEEANPLTIGRIRLLVLDQAGQPLPRNRIVSVPTVGGAILGLHAGDSTVIDLPPCDAVEVELTRTGQPPRLIAFDAAGTALVQEAVNTPPRTLARVQLARKARQRPIVRVLLAGADDRTAIHDVCYTVAAPSITGHALDRRGADLGSFRDTNGRIDLPGRDVVAVRLDAGSRPFCITQICVDIGLDQADRIEREEMLRHVVDEVARWQSDDEVLAPWTRYRLKIVTTVEVRDFQYDAGFNATRTFTQCAYFRTEGPPGLASYSVPVGHPQEAAGAPATSSDPPVFDSGVQDLERYVAQSVPPTVPGPGETPPLPRPVYRAYDVGVRFNENYVERMYRAAGRDLSLALYDNNNEPIRDRHGRLLLAANRWGRTDSVQLSASEERWIAHVNATTCVQIDGALIARDLTLVERGHVLEPQSVYEARLVPLLMHETFAGYTLGAEARGTGAGLTAAAGAGWTVRDEGSEQGPSRWIVRESGQPPARYVEQTTNVSAGAASRTADFAGGTLLVRGNDPRLDAAHPDQAPRWTDYRISVYVRSADDDLVGVGVRWWQRSGYLATFDRELNRRRLLRLDNGVATVLAESAGGYRTGLDMLVAIEAAGERLRVFADGALLFDLRDGRFPSGAVALYSGQNAGAQFRDIRVDDLRAEAPVVYRFKFTTSDFADFTHHIHSFPGRVFRADLADLAGLAAATASGVAPATMMQQPAEDEARAFATVAGKALGPAALQPVARADVTRLEQGGAALGLLVRTAEPIDWTRTALTLQRAPAQPLLPEMSDGPRLISASFSPEPIPQANRETVTVLLDEGLDPEGWRIQHRTLPSANAPAAADGTLLFAAGLGTESGPDAVRLRRLWRPPLADIGDFQIFEAPGGIGAQQWAAGAGVLRQDGMYYVVDAAGGGPPPPRWGTYAIRAGAQTWRELRFTARLRAVSPGAIGMVFRYADLTNHYRFAFDGPRGVVELIKVVNGSAQLLSTSTAALTLGHEYVVEIEALSSRLRVTVDGMRLFEVFDEDLVAGSVGFYTYLRPLPRFDRVTVEAVSRHLDPWTVHDHGAIAAGSTWSVEDGLLRQHNDMFAGAGPPSTAVAYRSGSAAITGDAAWTDVRITATAAPPSAGLAGLVFRWSDSDTHYRLLLDGAAQRQWLVRRSGGSLALLWQRTGALSSAELMVEAVGRRLRGWAGDTLLFDLHDTAALPAGRAGVLSLDGRAGAWSAFAVRHAAPGWEDWHVFSAAEGWNAAGRRFVVHAGRAADPVPSPARAGEMQLFQERDPAAFAPRLHAPGVDLRLVGPNGGQGHLRRFMPDSAYAGVTGARILRAADGTGFFVFVPAAGAAGASLPAGEYRLRLSFRRDNRAVAPESLVLSQEGDSLDESVILDVPWAAP